MKVKFFTTGLLAVLALSVLGCGELSKAGWSRKADRICSDVADKRDELFKHEVIPTNQNIQTEYADFLEDLGDLFQETSDRLNAIGEIETDQKANAQKDQILKSWENLASLSDQLVALARKADEQSFGQKSTEMKSAVEQMGQLSKNFGLKNCGQGNQN